MKRLTVNVLSLSLTACFLTEPEPAKRNTLGQLDLATELPQTTVTEAAPTPEQLAAAYQEIVALAPKASARQQANSRLAQLSLEQQQLAQEKGVTQESGYFDNTVNQYLALLANSEALDGRDEVLYQLAKAYFLKGDQQAAFDVTSELIRDYPDFAHNEELIFRQGEYMFNQKQYEQAKNRYLTLVESYPDSPLVSTSRYMLAWSDFKLFNYQASLNSFTQVLSLALEQDGKTVINIEQLNNSDRYLVADTLRIMSVIFSYSDFEQDPVSHYQQYGWQAFSFMNFDSLANYYIEQKRYLDAAKTYQSFITTSPEPNHKVDFALAQMSVFKKANFKSLLTDYEQQFIREFGVGSTYLATEPTDAHYLALKTLEKKYADRSYYQGQQLAQQNESAITAFSAAAIGYQRYLDTLQLKQQGDIDSHYLLAESLYQSQQWQKALSEYQTIAYSTEPNKYQSDAGFAVVSIYKTQLANKQRSQRDDETQHESVVEVVDNWLKFATTFSTHKSASTVVLQAFNLLFERQMYDVLLTKFAHVEQFSLSESEMYQAQLLAAHSHYNLQDYASAESAYKQLLAKSSEQASLVRENLAQSMIKQAEAVAETNPQLAADKYIALLTLLPSTLYREQVQYNLTQYLISLQLFSQASSWVDDFITRYPTSKNIESLQTQKIAIYKNTQRGDKLAAQYAYLATSHSDENTRRISLYQSAEHYRNMGDIENARLQFRTYAHRYPKPFAQNLQAKVELANIYQKQNKASERRFWLNKIIAAYKVAPESELTWAKAEAAKATEVFANDAFYVYQKSKLTIPLKTSLARKRKHMAVALERYQQLADYALEQYSTQANFKIAQIYHLMAQDIMSSERPKQLKDLALEQYELLLEEQAIPFEDQAIELYARNNQLLHSGLYDEWINKTLTALAKLMPARFAKKEVEPGENHAIY